MITLRRRTLLGALGLGAAGATLLGPLAARLARAGGPTPARFVFVVEGNCFEPVTMLAANARAALNASLARPLAAERWWYQAYRHNAPLVVANTDFASAPALGPVAAAPAVAAQTRVLLGLSSRIAGGGHSAMHGALSSTRTIAGVPGGQTIDAWLAGVTRVRRDAPYDAVRLGVSPNASEPLDFGTCAFGRGRAAPLILQPMAAFNSLFGAVGSAAAQAAFMRRRGLLDFARDDVRATLGAFSGNSRERAKLEAYLASVEELTARHERVVRLSPQLRANQPPPPEMNPLYATTDPLDRFRAHCELATAALKGELTNVAVIGCGTGGDFGLTYTSVNPNVGRHDLHHGSGSNATFLQQIHAVTRLQVEAIVRMASALAATPEAGAEGSMLDHTVIVFIGDNGEQHHSTASEFPVLLIGGQRLGLWAGGATVVYPGISASNHRQVSNLWNTLGYAAGQPLDEFGGEGPARRARGPLGELMG